MTRLVELADRFGSDKGSVRLPAHGYAFFYDMLFERFRDQPINILELGLARTSEDYRGRSELRTKNFSPSVGMWLEYFPNARVVGFDLSDFSQFQSERFTFVQGDLGKPEDLRKVAALGIGFDIIVDDGSHASYHQLLALAELFPVLNEGGFFVIEDLIYQPPKIEFEQPTSHTATQLLEAFLDLGYFPETQPIENTAFNAFLGSIHNILMVPYHNKRQKQTQLAVIQKQSGSRYHHYRSKVRFYDRAPNAAEAQSLRTQIKIDPENPYPHAHLAHIAIQAGSPAEALESIERAIALAPGEHGFYAVKVAALNGLGRIDEAEQFAVERISSGYAVDVFAGDLIEPFVNAHALEAAHRLIDHCLSINPKVSALHHLKGMAFEAAGDFEAAESAFRKAIDILPSKIVYYHSLYLLAEKTGRAETVLGVLRDAAPHFQREPQHSFLLLRCFLNLDRFDEAKQQAVKIPADSPFAERAARLIRKNRARRILKRVRPGRSEHQTRAS